MTDDSTPFVAVQEASKAVVKNEQEYDKVENVSEYVKVARKNLNLILFDLQKRKIALDTLINYSDGQKMKLLFNILDKDHDGHIHATELMSLFRRTDAGMTFKQSLEKSVTYIALYDADNDSTVDLEEFKNIVYRITAEADSNFHEMCEFIIMSMWFSTNRNTAREDKIAKITSGAIDEKVHQAVEYNNALADGRMRELFSLFDKDENNEVSFTELADGLYKMKDEKFWKHQESAMDIFLMVDEDANRTLDYNEFVKMVLNILHAAQVEFNEVAEAMKDSVANRAGMDSQALEQAKARYNHEQDLIDEFKEERGIKNALHYAKLHKLYDIWDTSNDGLLSYEELVLGLRKYMKTNNLVAMTEETLFTMLEFDKDEDQKLDEEEFANLIVKFAKKTDQNLHELIDFLAVLSLTENDAKEEEYIKSISEQANQQIKAVQNYDPDTGIYAPDTTEEPTNEPAAEGKPISSVPGMKGKRYDNFILVDNNIGTNEDPIYLT
mmetsp:Transcript_17037/g.25194  ORF Transcript_17037/g.25194 Transcript_17037/m.25194 type:complete len:496 (+) Transcript_17037:84-1571(+)|eukprot:CAMPEP_0194220734 /NCGR_PEP_ID=MMETSP0156-20130528/29112_1 /TAXON_ID=33649 /ORGANISM="Thalassionema nitzschioides, Strain L26-B" /LENGTH=495 /DNA_ID=CAMNT_0038950897 /DNA_START=23 /DNA_END=1510 /DNA_ORIENTATION=-